MFRTRCPKAQQKCADRGAAAGGEGAGPPRSPATSPRSARSSETPHEPDPGRPRHEPAAVRPCPSGRRDPDLRHHHGAPRRPGRRRARPHLHPGGGGRGRPAASWPTSRERRRPLGPYRLGEVREAMARLGVTPRCSAPTDAAPASSPLPRLRHGRYAVGRAPPRVRRADVDEAGALVAEHVASATPGRRRHLRRHGGYAHPDHVQHPPGDDGRPAPARRRRRGAPRLRRPDATVLGGRGPRVAGPARRPPAGPAPHRAGPGRPVPSVRGARRGRHPRGGPPRPRVRAGGGARGARDAGAGPGRLLRPVQRRRRTAARPRGLRAGRPPHRRGRSGAGRSPVPGRGEGCSTLPVPGREPGHRAADGRGLPAGHGQVRHGRHRPDAPVPAATTTR